MAGICNAICSSASTAENTWSGWILIEEFPYDRTIISPKSLESLLAGFACQDRDTVSETQVRCLLGEYWFVHQQYAQAQEQLGWISDQAEQLEHDYDDLLNEEIREAEVLLGIMQRYCLCSEIKERKMRL